MSNPKLSLAARVKARKAAQQQAEDGASDQGASDIQSTRTLTLSTGKVVNLTLKTYKGKAEIESKTRVDEENARNQDDLSREALADIIDSIKRVQLYPAVGYANDGYDSTVDGSRRRMSAILEDCDFQMEVADQHLTPDEAAEIVALSEKKQKLSDRDWGRFYQAKFDKLVKDGTALTQEEFAKQHNVSVGTMSRYLNAHSVPEELYGLFWAPGSINTVALSNRLIRINKAITKDGHELEQVINTAQEHIEKRFDDMDLESPDEHTELVFTVLNEQLAKKPKKAPGRKKQSTEPVSLYTGEVKGEYINYVDNTKDKATITLARINSEKRQKIKDFIAAVMAE